MRSSLILFLGLIPVLLFAQFPCHHEGAEAYAQKVKHEKIAFDSYYHSLNNNERAVNFPLNSVPVKIHILQDSPGNGRSIDSSGILLVLNRLNADFAATGFQFYKCGSINYLTNSPCNDLEFGTEFTPLYNTSAVPNVINIYFVRDLMFGGSPAAGVAPTPGGRDYILLRGGSALASITHEAGHYFGLLHTHGVSNTERSKEKVDGSNCGEEGDFFCDTPADPSLLNVVFSNCVYTGTWGDANAQAYTPDVHNHMSYSPASCRTRFSDEQIAFMYWSYQEYRNYLECSSLNINFTYAAAQICDSPYAVTLTNTSVGLSGFQWDVTEDDITDYTSNSATHTFGTSGIKYIHLKATLSGKVYHRHKKIELFKSKTVPSFENFNASTLQEGWRLLDMDGGRSWELAKALGPDGQYSNMLRFRNHGYISATAEDHIYSSAYNLTGLQNARLTFDLAYAPAKTTDTLKIYISTNCGKTYDNLIFYAWGDSLKSAPKTYSEFEPTAQTWKTITVSLSAYINNYVRFKIENVNTGGNTILIDNFRIDGGDGLKNVGFTTSRVAFFEGNANVSEGCRKYSIVLLPLHISAVPSGPVTVALATQGNAKKMHDYVLLDSTLIFPAGSNATKYIRLKIYDDASAEATEHIVLNITQVNGDNFTTSIHSNTCLVSIYDNEAQQLQTAVIDTILLMEDFNSETTYVPARWKVESDCPQCPPTGVVDSMIFWCTTAAAGGWFNMTESLDSSDYIIMWALDAYKGVPLKEYLTSPVMDASDYDSLILSFDNVFEKYPGMGFEKIGVQVWDGSQWVSVWTHIEYNDNLGKFYQPYTKTINVSAYANANFKVRFSFTDVDYGYFWALDNVKVRGQRIGYTPATQLSNSTAAYFGPNDTVQFIINNKAIATLVNESDWNYGCTIALIDRAGTGAQPYELPDAIYSVTDKTLHIVPTDNNPQGNYSITLYYTQNEMAGWKAATGNREHDMTVIKTGGPVKNITPANPSANGATNQYCNTQRLSPYKNGWQLTGNFYTGFSGFGGGNPSGGLLPVEYGEPLTGEHVPAIGNVLKWATFIEINNDYFTVQRSADGITFEDIATVQGHGNSTEKNSYTYTDKKIEPGIYYYRLRQVDFDGQAEPSDMVAITINQAAMAVAVYPNPAGTHITVTASENSTLVLCDVAGIALGAATVVKANEPTTINTTGYAPGIYIAKLYSGNNSVIVKRIAINK